MPGFGLSFGVSAREPLRRIGEVARTAEEQGFDAAWVIDSQVAMKDVHVALTVAALATSTIELGTGVTNPLTRHITVTANAIAAVDEVSGGRALLGLGSGDSAVFPLGWKPAPIAEMRPFLQDVRQLLNGKDVARPGQPAVRLAGVTRPVPIFVAASQPRMLALAGEQADGVILLGAADVALTEWQLAQVHEGARAAGRDPRDVFVDLWLGISLGDDRRQALEDVKAFATSQARWFSRWKALPPPLAPFEDEFTRAFEAYRFADHLSRRAEHAHVVSDRFADFVALAGPAEACRERIEALLALNVDRITFTLLSGNRLERVRQLGAGLVSPLR
jgi:5,10-methylenetetrahydromethanopterin reductase